jgi:O-phospho-L-seryl-tRNASec:L-selenocysteinyl-tRNA synthase
MDHFEDLLAPMVRKSYIRQGLEAIKSRQNLLEVLLTEHKLPMDGWDDTTIEYMIQQLSMMDSNNFPGNIGLGEREGRVFSSLVSKRHYGLAHGIGRSGDISEVQPKAAGSSTLYKLANYLVQHALEISGFAALRKSLIIPMATGMTIALSLLTLKQSRPQAKYVLWPRIDQKSCFKAILTMGMIPIVIENRLVGDEISTDVDALRRVLGEVNHDEILCILTTTSCFAPRRPDRIDVVSQICKDSNIPHVINNAYGLQCPLIAKLLTRAATIGRVDYVVQSTDKNFMVPVGGAVLSSPTPELIDQAAKLYPGRASSSPIVDMFITLLSMGQRGLLGLHQQRLQCLPLLIDGVQRVAAEFGERVLVSPCNSISIGLTVSQSLAPPRDPQAESQAEATGEEGRKHVDAAFIGSMLFKRSVSGARVVAMGSAPSKIGAHVFNGWGAHISNYHSSYLTVACAVGVTPEEVAASLLKIRKVMIAARKMGRIPDVITPQGDNRQEDVSLAGGEEERAGVCCTPLSSQWIDMYQRKARNIG